MPKRTLEAFFQPPGKRTKSGPASSLGAGSPLPSGSSSITTEVVAASTSAISNAPTTTLLSTSHQGYPFPIADLPPEITASVEELLLTTSGKEIKNQPHLDLLYFEPLIPQPTANELFTFLRAHLPFYRVKYTINRFGKSLDINTPRYTTVFGIDETSRFHTSIGPARDDTGVAHMTSRIVETTAETREVAPAKYKSCVVPPRPIPPCLALLKTLCEALTNDAYNFVLVNYYSNGQDSISFHSDDERFLGDNPAIASFSLGARRDFLLKHKPPGAGPGNGSKGKSNSVAAETEKVYPGTTQIKFPLGSGDMIVMRGETQRNWLHSIPKRSGKNSEADKGRINITVRKAMKPSGTENYYQYNVGSGPPYRWDDSKQEMVLWTA